MTAPARLAWLNSLAAEEAAAELLACCGSSAWARALAACRPFAGEETLFAAAERIWWGLRPEDWREAFAAHPRIGESPAAGRSAAWSEAEQAGARRAGAAILDELAAANHAYEARFGHVFLICAAGKSAEEMLAALRDRMVNEPPQELRIAAAEQAKITRLRLARLRAPGVAVIPGGPVP
ncbi:MAG TPA: 2-oxo-4-hydroxy-4-carboxy-5-ureidoimidazoline decarboxylase [Thermoanaerobaculia bacterium]|nr:2-oxo-4-hydroxy-4-carboxy-5-ureidoimidazoline decarboxylase [Thermoanaerobaculia bacterium]